MTEWWTGIAPGQAIVECGGEQHRLRWDAGSLAALDHDDAEGERALAALGGQRCTCVDLLDAWGHHADDLRVLVLGRRSAIDELVEQVDPMRGNQGGWYAAPRRAPRSIARGSITVTGHVMLAGPGSGPFASAGRVSAQQRAEDELTALMGLGGALPDRLAATVAATWRERLEQKDRSVTRQRRVLQSALYGRVLGAMRAWLGPAGMPSVALTMISERRRPSMTMADGVVEAGLPFGWLVDVWARDLTTVAGRFTLSVMQAEAESWTLSTVASDFGATRTVALRL